MSTSTNAAPPSVGARAPDFRRRTAWARHRERADVAATPRWARAGLGGVLLLAALLTMWGLSRNGWSNEYYAAAVRSATESWKAWFFGSLDPGSFITVDKPPLAIWLMGLSTRIFGFSSLAMLLPQALCTVGAVALLHATVRRFAGHGTALAAALALALTPITVAIGRVNNPDALLVLLLVASAYFVVRAVESGRTRQLAWAGVMVGLAFMTKMLQGWMVLPALAATYLAFGPHGVGRRIGQLLVAFATTVAVSVAWPLAVTLWPGSKPYIGGSTDGGVWDLILGYNGLGRIFGQGGGGGGANFGGEPGLLRLFNTQVGGQIAWLIPLAIIGCALALWSSRSAPRTDLRRAGVVLFGLWALVHAAVFSFAEGTFHPYYVSALAPAVAVLAAIGAFELVRLARRSWAGVAAFDLALIGTAWLAYELLGRTTDAPAWAVVAVPAGAIVALLASPALRLGAAGRWPHLGTVAAVAASVAVLAAPASYSVATATRTLNGNNVVAGPAGISAAGGMGGGGGGMSSGSGGPGGAGQNGTGGGGQPPSGASGAQSGNSQSGNAGMMQPPSNSGTTSTSSNTASSTTATSSTDQAATTNSGSVTKTTDSTSSSSDSAASASSTRSAGGGGGSVSTALIKYLQANQGSAKYLVAATGSQTTASIIITTGEPVVTIGGFTGSDAAPTVSQLAQMVKSGELKYVLIGGNGGGGAGSSSSITQWVQEHGTAVTSVETGSGTLYKVTA
ncbi:MAG: glycosyltransferase family 39 protein [Patulibacter sp.]